MSPCLKCLMPYWQPCALKCRGIEITEATVEEERGRTVYEIEGVADGIEYEFEVTADGKILEMESEEADD